jgi:hypothetical protein
MGSKDLRRMRRGALGAAIACLALTATAHATHSNGEGPNKDFVNQSSKQIGVFIFTFGVFDAQIHVDAQARAALGADAQGHFSLNLTAGSPNVFPPGTELRARGEVRCLDAVGSTSVWRGIVTESADPANLLGASMIGKQIDGGEPGHGGDQAGTHLGPAIGPNPPPGSCNALSGIPVSPIDQGNVVVHDGV